MGFFESLLYVIWRGVAIGILISAPMGPVGILVIQRTLYKGRKSGLFTGVGAAISDLFYCILTGFGLSFIEEFLERNQNIIQLAGSAVLIAFAIYLFKKNPASSLKTPQEEAQQISPHKNILGGFLFTFSNPLILFLIIGLFARFNYSIPEISFYYYIAGYIAIFVGAVVWWEFVTFSVNKLRAHFNLRSMWLINRIIGVIILLFAVVGIVTGITNLANAETINWNRQRGYLPFKNAGETGVIIDNSTDTLVRDHYSFKDNANELHWKFRSKNMHGHPSKKYTFNSSSGETLNISTPSWGFYLSTDNDTIYFLIKGTEIPENASSSYGLNIQAKKSTGELLSETFDKDNFNPYQGDNLWEFTLKDKVLSLGGGDKSIKPFMQFPFEGEISGIGYFAAPGGNIVFSDIILEYKDRRGTTPVLSINDLEGYFAESEDPMEGYWMVFDRELEESLLKLGGTYKLACTREGDDYLFSYIEGAGVNSDNWNLGDDKIRLKSTPFTGVYDVEWIDSMKEPLNKGISAQTGIGGTLLIQFPYQSSKIRLRKISQ